MGSYLEINDTLQITTEQGFPADLFNLDRHRREPIQLDDVRDRVFEFSNKTGPRIFQLDPVRVFWCHNIDGLWLAWGQVAIVEQTIRKIPDPSAKSADDALIWATSGRYRILKIYEPAYQQMFTSNELPPEVSYFQLDETQ